MHNVSTERMISIDMKYSLIAIRKLVLGQDEY